MIRNLQQSRLPAFMRPIRPSGQMSVTSFGPLPGAATNTVNPPPSTGSAPAPPATLVPLPVPSVDCAAWQALDPDTQIQQLTQAYLSQGYNQSQLTSTQLGLAAQTISQNCSAPGPAPQSQQQLPRPTYNPTTGTVGLPGQTQTPTPTPQPSQSVTASGFPWTMVGIAAGTAAVVLLFVHAKSQPEPRAISRSSRKSRRSRTTA